MWQTTSGYDRFMGRWSRILAADLVESVLRAGAAPGRWLDVGCGTGVVTAAALEAGVAHVTAVDPSPAFIAGVAQRFEGQPVQVVQADGEHLPDGPFDAAVMCLALNFTPDPVATLRAISAALDPDGYGIVAVWDYDDERSFLYRCHAAIERVLGHRSPQDERSGFAVCTVEGLQEAARQAGWTGAVSTVDVPTPFADPEDLWDPFLEGIGPAGGWIVQQDATTQQAVREQLLADVFGDGEGPVTLCMRALVVTTR